MTKLELTTYVDVVRYHSQIRGDATAFIFLNGEEEEARKLSFSELDQRARVVACELQRRGARGQRVLLLYDPGLDFIVAFLGCLYAGAVAVPAAPPTMRDARIQHLQGIIRDSGITLVLAAGSVIDRVADVALLAAGCEQFDLILTELLDDTNVEAWRMPPIGRQDLAFLQYTSGSSGQPRGVRISHDNLLANQAAIETAFGHGPETVFVGWAPLFHDMGLIGNVLQPLYLGVPSILMSPLTFLRKPGAWLRAISRYRATTSGGPNFAYDLCTARVSEAERAELDLSTWSVAFNGAEPIQAGTLERFASAFANSGFRKQALHPCYGMAEATLLVTSARPHQFHVTIGVDRRMLEKGEVHKLPVTDRASVALVSSGAVQGEGQRLIIADPKTRRRLPDGTVGEIWISGNCIAEGYWRRDIEDATFKVTLAGDDEAVWYRSGDLGFLVGGELYVTGRHTELIIVRGRNHYPQDIEQTVERADASLRPHSGAAFLAPAGGAEQLVVIQEVERRRLREFDAARVAAAVRAAVARQHELMVADIVFVRPGTVPKTSSGKIRRAAARAAYLGDAFNEARLRPTRGLPGSAEMRRVDRTKLAHASASAGAILITQGLIGMLSDILKHSAGEISPHYSIAALGADSIATVTLQRRLEEWLGATLPLDVLLSDLSIAELAARLDATPNVGPRPGDKAPSGATEGPASEYQQAIWLKHSLEPNSNACNLAVGIRLEAEPDRGRLRAAIARLLRCHPGLLTAFGLDRADRGLLRQAFVDPASTPLALVDARGLGLAGVKAAISQFVDRPFRLDTGETFRAALFQLDGGNHVVVLAAHHIVADLWSLHTIFDECAAAMLGNEAASDTAQITAVDYASWQRELLGGPRGEVLKTYWRSVLAPPLPAQLALPVDAKTSDSSADDRADCRLLLRPELVARLDDIAARAGATPGMLYLAAFKTLLHRYTGETDMLVTVPVAVRSLGKFDGLVGYAVNPLPIRVDMNGDPPFTGLLDRVRLSLLSALEHREMPLSRLVSDARLTAVNGRTSIGQVMLVWQGGAQFERSAALRDAGRKIAFAGMEAVVEDIAPPGVHEDIVLTLAPARDGGVSGRIQFARGLFRSETINRMRDHFLTLLAAIAAEPSRRLSALSLLPQYERDRLIALSGGAEPPGGDLLSYLRIAQQCGRTPNAIAVMSGDHRISYAELAKQSDLVAGGLRLAGAGRGSVIGVNLARSCDLVVAMLAVWKAGAAFLSLDPALPVDRLAGYVADAGCPLIIGARVQSGEVRFGTETVDFDALKTALPEAAPDAATLDDLAYVLFTSGSTGRPKGVQIEHRAVSSLLAWATQQYTRQELSAVLAGTSVGFDISIFEIFAPLLVGGTVVLAQSILDLPNISHPITLINTVPSAGRALLELDAIPASVRTINLAGEPLSQSLVDAIYDRTGVERIYDLYGPTEDTVYSTFTLRTRGGLENIGRPLGGTRAYVADGRLGLVPLGVAGELVLAGPKLARGYIGQPALTAAAFMTDSNLIGMAQRIYRTGDLVRQMPDGRLVYIGRRDNQVKLRGYRIELGEIEQQLLALAEVRDAVVIVRGDLDERRLIAFVVPCGDDPPDPRLLNARLSLKLPKYMLPSSYRFLREMPRNANGKLARDRLMRLRLDDDPADEIVAPRSPTEIALHRLWCGLLSGQPFGIYEDFFALGGDSLQAMQLCGAIRREFNVEIAPGTVFARPTILALAEAVDLADVQDNVACMEVLL
jgi:amino acid adenylation domain-containing protein